MIGPINVGPTFEDEKSYGAMGASLRPLREDEYGNTFHERRLSRFYGIRGYRRRTMFGPFRYQVYP